MLRPENYDRNGKETVADSRLPGCFKANFKSYGITVNYIFD